ncbi:type II toxin-antitoxin system RelE/ParE family toxin [Asticcacaulis sp.]|uniref:type II toxin-antitoxin system RelE/ParE family toxin n=1 Tax=Asticcacaulis sp. TaxID=1872648 RepID=UPI003F7C47B3
MRVVFRKTARRDLLDIATYIGRDAPVRAQSYIGELRGKCQGLVENPYSGSPRPDVLDDLRIVPHGNYVIYYLVQSEKIIILRISHGARLMDAVDLSEN